MVLIQERGKFEEDTERTKGKQDGMGNGKIVLFPVRLLFMLSVLSGRVMVPQGLAMRDELTDCVSVFQGASQEETQTEKRKE